MYIFVMMPEQDKIILPPKYYLEYFQYVLKFVIEKYESIMSSEEVAFVTSFNSMSEDAQCLFVRITIRKGYCFRISKFQYEEIGSIPLAEEELMSNGFLINFESDPDLDVNHLFKIFTKVELHDILSGEVVSKIPKSIKKTDLEQLVLEELTPEEIVTCLATNEGVLAQGFREEWSIIKLIFFGNTYGNMADFVIRDVGNAKFQQFDEQKFSASFNTREELIAVWNVRVFNQEFVVLQEESEPAEVFHWFTSLNMAYYLSLERSSRGAQKLVNKIGYYLERLNFLEEALTVYTHTTASPSRERQVRIYKKLKEEDKACEVAREMLQDSNDAKENYFASDFLSKAQKTLKSTTVRQKEGIVLKIPIDYRNRVEAGVVEYFLAQGQNAIHSENFIWKGLFGLILWEIIFDPEHNSIHQPLQRRPSDLSNRDFYERRKEDITTLLANHKNKKQFWKTLNNNYMQYEGTANPFVSWHQDMIIYLKALVDKLTLKQLKSVVTTIALNPSVRSSGFPDLFVWGDDGYYFYEVKSPTDHLSEKQLFWLEHFDNIQLKAEIALIEWVEK